MSFSAIEPAGRANPNITKVIAGARPLSKGLVVVGAVVSLYAVSLADDWKDDLGQQVSSWSLAIERGYIGSGIGAIFGPVGAVLGGIAGGIVGSLADEGAYSALASWFFGSTSGDSAVQLLGRVFDQARQLASSRIERSGQKFHTHQLLASQYSVISGSGDATSTTVEMIDTQSKQSTDGVGGLDLPMSFRTNLDSQCLRSLRRSFGCNQEIPLSLPMQPILGTLSC